MAHRARPTPSNQAVSRRTALIGLLGCVPLCAAAAGVALRGPTPSALAPAQSPLDELGSLLQRLQAQRLQASALMAGNVAAAPAARRAQAASIEGLAQQIDGVALRLRAMRAPPAAQQQCATLAKQLYDTGYIDGAQFKAILQGQFSWSDGAIEAAAARGRAAAGELAGRLGAAVTLAPAAMPGPVR
jgi:hypothetical protein